ncbi:MAG: GyrI-like domain-containing protein [Phycisphaerales bacterium]|nr:MAG: GyrI-like domain-containing protein [Phycisphaerales bacterium]
MRMARIWLVLLTIPVVMFVGIIQLRAKEANEQTFSIREADEQVVLYTIHRGSYEMAGRAIGKLFALAGQKGMRPSGPLCFVYLNDPKYVSSRHWLTEIRIPVAKEALKLGGTLGEMTDVKTVPAMKVAVAVKPEGQADPGPIYERLHAWIRRAGYVHIEDPREEFLTNAMAGDYAGMKSEIRIPVEKVSE